MRDAINAAYETVSAYAPEDAAKLEPRYYMQYYVLRYVSRAVIARA